MEHKTDAEIIAHTHNTARFFTEHRQVALILLMATFVWGWYGYRPYRSWGWGYRPYRAWGVGYGFRGWGHRWGGGWGYRGWGGHRGWRR